MKEVQPGSARPDCYQASVKEPFILSNPSLILRSTSRRGPRTEQSLQGRIRRCSDERCSALAKVLGRSSSGSVCFLSWGGRADACVQSHNILSQHAPRTTAHRTHITHRATLEEVTPSAVCIRRASRPRPAMLVLQPDPGLGGP